MAHGGIPWTGPIRADRQIVGRHREVRLLEEALRSAEGGTARLVFLVGQAGIGKTRLLDEITKQATRRGAQVLRATGLALPARPLSALRGVAATVAPELVAIWRRSTGLRGW